MPIAACASMNLRTPRRQRWERRRRGVEGCLLDVFGEARQVASIGVAALPG
jgi:hypothetical protein